jgi:hypothetical protein
MIAFVGTMMQLQKRFVGIAKMKCGDIAIGSNRKHSNENAKAR